MRSFLPLILLAFPIAEIYVLVKLFNQYGIWVLLYLVTVFVLGLQLIRGEKSLLNDRIMQNLSAGGNPIKTMMGTARNMIAGVLLMVPGVITDVIAVVLLLIPMQQGAKAANNSSYKQEEPETEHRETYEDAQPTESDVIEGEYTRVKDDKGQ